MIDWSKYLPNDSDVQVSKSQDFEACASYSAIHIAEMVLKRSIGLFFEFSERYTAKTSDTQPWGNTLQNVVNALNINGLCLTQYWPELTYSTDYENIDWAEYYQDIPANILANAYRVSASFIKLSQNQVAQALETSPVWTIVKTGSGQLHCVAQINETQFYDSYEIRVKNFSDGYSIQSQYQLLLKFLNMPNSEFVQKQGTQEYGFYLPSLSEDALKDKAQNLGLNILNADGTINFSLAKQVTGL